MRKVVALMMLFVLAFALPSPIHAAIVDISVDGDLTINVLSYESPEFERGSIEVKKVFDGKIPIGEKINLSNNGGKAKLLVSSNGESFEADVTSYNGNIIEIEEKAAPKRVRVMYENGSFLIQQRGYTAKTSYPINIDAATKEFSVRTDSGVTFLTILPYDAMASLFRAGILTEIGEDGNVELDTSGEGALQYIAHGERSIKLFRLLEVTVPVTATVSVASGELAVIEQPLWLSVFGYFLS